VPKSLQPTIEAVTTTDGRTLHLERRGAGRPIVLFESGMGVSRCMWGAVVPAIAERTTAVVYDRAGLGRSPATTGPRDLDHLVADLEDVLDHLGGGPFVLVGHSWGGPIVRAAAARRPGQVAGLVLVDQTDERCDLFFSKVNERQLKWSPRLLPLAARLGLLRRVTKKLSVHLPDDWAAPFRAEDGAGSALRTQLAELASSTDDLRRLRDQPLVLPDVPVSIISGVKNGFGEGGRRPAIVEAHRQSAAALPRGRHVTADRSSHYVPFTDAELVVAEILRVLDDAAR
jgi:pimeloyl-ACP methyl ester carboxylesterase